LLESIDGAFDQVALLDTGSTDRTVEIFTDWASRQSLSLGYAVGHFDWIDDFGAARNAAAALLETDWEAWADCDDVIRGATRLRRDVRLVAQSGGDWLHARYQWAPASPPFTTRPYACRRGAGTWVGPIHERKVLAGRALPPPCAAIAGEPVVWQQRRDHLGPVNGLRDLSILCKWLNGCADESGPRDRLVTQLMGERLGDARGRDRPGRRTRRHLPRAPKPPSPEVSLDPARCRLGGCLHDKRAWRDRTARGRRETDRPISARGDVFRRRRR
jgi:hypothetical protein